MRPLRIGSLLLMLTALCAVYGCATRQSVLRLSADIERLERENFQLRKNLAEAQVHLNMQRDASPEHDQAAAGFARPVQDLGDSAPSVDPATPPIASPAGAITAEPILSAAYGHVTATRLEPASHASSGSGAAGAAGAAPSSAAVTSGGADPQRLMESAQQRLEAKDASGAIAQFLEIVKHYPDDALADDAQFLAGEAYFQAGRYDDAIGEYRKVVDQFPFGDRVPYAFLKIAFSYLALNQKDLALDNFKTVSEAYPGTEAATVARQQMAHIKASGG